MASTTDAKSIIDKASRALGDLDKVRWVEAELLAWLNAGQLEIATLVPNSNIEVANVQLIAGTKQAAPTDAIRINRFTRNMGVGGSTPGRSIKLIERDQLSKYIPDWTNATANIDAVRVIYEPQFDPKTFYVYPPQPVAPGYIEIIYQKMPTNIPDASVGTKITIQDHFANALLDYILYRAFGDDAEHGNQAQRSDTHYKMFANAIGAKFGADSELTKDKANV